MHKVLVIDDSALMRKHLRTMLEGGGHEVMVARNGQEGLDRVRSWQPDVVTLDINMPVMDGLTCLSHIMTEAPCPVIMVSSLTEKGALSTFEALEMGALDYIPKPDGTVSLEIRSIEELLLEKVDVAARSRKIRKAPKPVSSPPKSSRKSVRARPTRRIKRGADIVVVGVSTGGPRTVEEVIEALPADFPAPILIAQHMPAKFTQVFAERLNGVTAINVVEVSGPTELLPGTVFIGKGGADMEVIKRGSRMMATSMPQSSDYLWHPSVERMVRSVMKHYSAESVIGVQLTGMGNDGADALAELHQQGARTIAESEESAVIFGMPKELIARDGATEILHSKDIAQQLLDWV